MPYRWVSPELACRENNIEVFHSYKDDMENDKLSFWYEILLDNREVFHFDVRDLPGWTDGLDQETINTRIIKRAIRKKIIP